MTPLLPLAGGVLALVVAALLLRTYGARYRVARLLATVPAVSLSDALAAAKAGERRYVRIEGRVDSEESFEDAASRHSSSGAPAFRPDLGGGGGRSRTAGNELRSKSVTGCGPLPSMATPLAMDSS